MTESWLRNHRSWRSLPNLNMSRSMAAGALSGIPTAEGARIWRVGVAAIKPMPNVVALGNPATDLKLLAESWQPGLRRLCHDARVVGFDGLARGVPTGVLSAAALSACGGAGWR